MRAAKAIGPFRVVLPDTGSEIRAAMFMCARLDAATAVAFRLNLS